MRTPGFAFWACLVALAFLTWGGLFSVALAQDEAPASQSSEAASEAPATEPAELTPAPLSDEYALQLQQWGAQLDGVEIDINAEGIGLDALGQLRDRLTGVREEIATFLGEITPVHDEQNAILNELIPPEGVQVETQQMVDLRQRILDLNAQLQPARLLAARAQVLRDEVAQLRAQVFARQLFARTSSVLNLTFWTDGLAALPDVAADFQGLVLRSFDSVRNRASSAAFAGLGALLVLLVALAIPARRWALRRSVRAEGHSANRWEKILASWRIVFSSAGVPAIGFVLLLVALNAIGGLSLKALEFVAAFSVCVTLYFAVSGIVRALLAPGRPNWRMVPMEEAYASQAAFFIRLAALAYVIGEFLRVVARGLFAPLPAVQIVEVIPVLVASIAVLGAVRAILRGLARPPNDALDAGLGDGPAPSMISLLWRWTIPVAAIVALAALLSHLLGYLALAAFLIDRLVWTAAVLAALHLAASFIDEASNALFHDDAKASSWVQQHVGLSRSGLGQFGVLLSGIVKLVLIVAAGTFIIAPFGVETEQFTTILGSVFTGIEVGGFSFSLTSLLIALGLVFVGVVVTRGVQGWLENRYLPRTSIDTGLKASIRTGIGYIGIIIAAAVGLSYLGLNLENIALVAGALSVGIGFGLQSIVSNFVSGLILLAERPFKQGDWIVVGDEQGIVKRINVRATELQTFDRATVLIPNSDFIAGTVKNRVHRDTLGRIDVPVGVGYDSDPEQVKAILLEIANAHPQTLSYPEPAAFFVEFGANSLDFMLFAYLADVGNGYGVRSDIRFEIFRRFKQEGIEIPFAQSDVTIRNMDQILAAMAKAGVAAPEGMGGGGLAADEADKQTGVRTVPAPDPYVSTPAELRSSRRIEPEDVGGNDGPEGGPGDGPVIKE